MGTPAYAAVSLARLLRGPHRVKAVVTRPDKPRGRGQQTEPSPVKKLALEAGLEILDPASARDPAFLARLRELDVDLGVVVAYGRILPKEALEAPRLGCINAHASLLPALRGAAPIERAVLAGLTETGVTIMQMNEGLDEGDIILLSPMTVPDSMTGTELRAALAERSAEVLAEALDLFAAGPVTRIPQDHAAATFAPPLRKEEAALDWSDDATSLRLRVRAFAPKPGAFTFDGKTRLKVLEARVTDEGSAGAAAGTLLGTSADGLRVACGSGVLEIVTLQPEGKRPMSALDYERGMRGADPRRRFGAHAGN